MSLVQLKKFPGDRYPAWTAASIKEYAAANVRSGRWNPDEAPQKAAEAYKALLPNGLDTPDHYIYEVQGEVGGKTVAAGHVWLWINTKIVPKKGYIYDIAMSAEHRGMGFGKAAMLAIEAKAKELGAAAIGLHVFAYNENAHALYKKLDYAYVGHMMEKSLVS